MATLGGSDTRIIYLSVVNGKFAQRVSPGTEGAEQRTTKDGKVVTEKKYNHASGIITKLELRSHEFGGKIFESMCITLDDEVQMQFSGGIDNSQNKNILNTLLSPDCDITKKLTFIANIDDEGYSQVFLLQNQKGIKRYSNKETPRDVPQPVKRERMGKTTWDWTEQDEWFYTKFHELAQKVEKNVANKELGNNHSGQNNETDLLNDEPTDEEYANRGKDEVDNDEVSKAIDVEIAKENEVKKKTLKE